MTHLCVGNQTIIGSDNVLTPGLRQAIFWANAEILLIGRPRATNVSEILIKIHILSFKKNVFEHVVWKMAADLSRPQCITYMYLFDCK